MKQPGRKRPRWRLIFGGSAGIILIGAVGLGGWWMFLLQRSRVLFDESRQYPTDYFVGDASRPLKLYLVLGDSTAVGAGASRLEATVAYQCARAIAAGGFHVRVVNAARSGARVGDVLRDQAPEVQRLHPDYITVSVGANDSTHFTSLHEYVGTWRWLSAILSRSHARVVVASTPDMSVVPALPPGVAGLIGRRAAAQNVQLRQVLRHTHIRLADLFEDGKLDPRLNRRFYAPDLFHPADAGYRVWAGLFRLRIIGSGQLQRHGDAGGGTEEERRG